MSSGVSVLDSLDVAELDCVLTEVGDELVVPERVMDGVMLPVLVHVVAPVEVTKVAVCKGAVLLVGNGEVLVAFTALDSAKGVQAVPSDGIADTSPVHLEALTEEVIVADGEEGVMETLPINAVRDVEAMGELVNDFVLVGIPVQLLVMEGSVGEEVGVTLELIIGKDPAEGSIDKGEEANPVAAVAA